MPLQVATSDKFDDSSDPLDFETPATLLSSTLTRTSRPFTITTESYISLCSRVYAACCAELSGFADNIPESAFQYYAVFVLWKRFAEIVPNITQCKSQFFNEIRQYNEGTSMHIPSPLHTYLKGIGHFSDPHNCDRQFILPVLPMCEKIGGIPYTFGKVNAKTHAFYEAFPAPGVAALRIVADIKYTRNACEENLLWDLPRELQPDIVESHIESNKPTKNLLGWAPAQALTNDQLQLFEKLKIDDDFMQDNYSSSNTSAMELFKVIYRYIAEYAPWKAPLSGLPAIGSVVQGVAIERHDYFEFDRSAMYCEGSISACSRYLLNDELMKGAVISGYRMTKESIRNRHCWSCYDYNEYKNVPESWIRSRNTVYNYGSPGGLNEKVYATAYINKRVLQNECILNALNPQNWNLYM